MTEVELSQARSKFLDGREITIVKSIFHHHYVLKFLRMVKQLGTSQKLEAQSGRVENTKPLASREQEEGGPKGM